MKKINWHKFFYDKAVHRECVASALYFGIVALPVIYNYMETGWPRVLALFLSCGLLVWSIDRIVYAIVNLQDHVTRLISQKKSVVEELKVIEY